MSVLSLSFALFVLVTLALFQWAPARYRPHVLLAASLAFYASRSLRDTLLLLAVSWLVHATALALTDRRSERAKQRLLAVTVTALVVCLAGFKLAAAAFAPADALGIDAADGPALRVLVPLGLSYYLFKLIGYLLDVYWEREPAQQSLLSLVLYASFFPQIVSGPIQRSGDFFAQLERLHQLDTDAVAAGLRRILFGVFKKIAIADRLAATVEAVHADPSAFSSLELLIGAYVFALQLYTDFSGVTDIAIGVGQLFGIRGPENFSFPFFARNLQEYWRRWHISLSSWLAAYVFTPLRMSLRDYGRAGLALAILINMVSIGVWHGANLTYLAFGITHGVFMVVSVLTLKARDRFVRRHPRLAPVRALAAPLLTFHLVVLALIVFRAPSLDHALSYLRHIAIGPTLNGIAATRLDLELLKTSTKVLVGLPVLAVSGECLAFLIAQRAPGALTRAPRAARWALYYAVILGALFLSRAGQENFIYAQF